MKNTLLVVSVYASDNKNARVIADAMAEAMLLSKTNFVKAITQIRVHGPVLKVQQGQTELPKYRLTFDLVSDFSK